MSFGRLRSVFAPLQRAVCVRGTDAARTPKFFASLSLRSQVSARPSALVPVRTFTAAAASKPSLEEAGMYRDYFEMPSDVLVVLATQGDHGARQERLIREIMAVDKVDWDGAQPRLHEMTVANKNGMWLATLPYKIGLTAALVGGFSSIPLCFNLDTALWFNTNFVTTEVPPDEDLETWLEVGSWTWNWMEPPLGQISFFLLTLQYARAQMQNLNFQPYTEWMQSRRARSLQQKFPQYHAKTVGDFAITDGFE